MPFLFEFFQQFFKIMTLNIAHGRKFRKPDEIRDCIECNEEFIISKNYAHDYKFCYKECQYKYQSKIMKGKFRVDRIIIKCKYCGDDFEVKLSEQGAKFCCHKCFTDWYSENLVGENSPVFGKHPSDVTRERLSAYGQGQDYNAGEWTGYSSNKRDYVTPIDQCTQMNEWFENSHAHHISKSIVIFIPKILHYHIGHNIKTGQNMAEMNMLALQYINGCYDG